MNVDVYLKSICHFSAKAKVCFCIITPVTSFSSAHTSPSWSPKSSSVLSLFPCLSAWASAIYKCCPNASHKHISWGIPRGSGGQQQCTLHNILMRGVRRFIYSYINSSGPPPFLLGTFDCCASFGSVSLPETAFISQLWVQWNVLQGMEVHSSTHLAIAILSTQTTELYSSVPPIAACHQSLLCPRQIFAVMDGFG